MSNSGTQGGRLLRGATWTLAARLAERFLGLGSMAILARLLSPSDFGLMGMALAVVAAVELLGAFGLDWALVRQPDLQRRHLDTAFGIRLSMAVITVSLLLLLAYPAAVFYREPRVQPILMWFSAGMAVAALENPGVIYLRRDFQFDREFMFRTGAKVAGVIVAITVAVIYRSYAALLAGTLASRVVSTLISYRIHPFRPRPSLEARKELLSFSIWMFLNNVLEFFRTRMAVFIIGRVAGARALGLYEVSTELAHLATTELAAPINRAVFSSYAENQRDKHVIRDGYLRVAALIWLVALPIAVGIFLTAPEAVYLLLGAQWMDAIPTLRVLAVAGAVVVLSSNTSYVYWALGKPRLVLIINGITVLVMIPGLVVLGSRMGPTGAAIAYLAAVTVSLPFNLGILHRVLEISLGDLWARAWRTLLAAGLMAGAVWAARPGEYPTAMPAVLQALAVLVPLGAGVYAGALFGAWRLCGRPAGPEAELLQVLRRVLGRDGASPG